jgi:hypothetical protein
VRGCLKFLGGRAIHLQAVWGMFVIVICVALLAVDPCTFLSIRALSTSSHLSFSPWYPRVACNQTRGRCSDFVLCLLTIHRSEEALQDRQHVAAEGGYKIDNITIWSAGVGEPRVFTMCSKQTKE